jgi:hypothetical protein
MAKILATEENRKRMERLKSYAVGNLTVDQFLQDGWNIDDPFEQKLGILTAGLVESEDQYTLERIDSVDVGCYPFPVASELLVTLVKSTICGSMESFKDNKARDKLSTRAYLKPDIRVYGLRPVATLVFKSRNLASIKFHEINGQ